MDKAKKINFIRLELYDFQKQKECLIEIVNIIRLKKIDVIHLHPGNSLIVGSLAAYITDIPVVTTIHGIYRTQLSDDPINKIVDKIICVSKESAEFQVANAQVLNSKIEIIPNSVEIYDRLEHHHFFKNDIILMTYIGRLDKDKLPGIIKLLYSIPALSQHFKLRLKIIGDGSEFEYVYNTSKIINEIVGEEIISLIGGVTNTKDFINESDIIFGVGRVILEAIASNRFAFCIGSKGYEGIIDIEKLSRIATVNFTDRKSKDYNVNLLIKDLSLLVQNKVDYINALQATQEFVKYNFSTKKSGESHVLLYKELLKRYNLKKIKSDNYNVNGISDELAHLLNSCSNMGKYYFQNAKRTKVLISPIFSDNNDIWSKVLKKLICIVNYDAPITIVYRIQNKYQTKISEIITKIENIITSSKITNLPDILLDIEFQDTVTEEKFLSSIDIFIPTSKTQVATELTVKLKGKRIILFDDLDEINE